jgi:hypothetical protein
MLVVWLIERELDRDGWLLSILATAASSGWRRATPKLALSRTLVKAGRGWTARRPTGGALDGSTQTMEPPPRHIDGAVSMVKVVEEKGDWFGSVIPRPGRDAVDGLSCMLDGAQRSARPHSCSAEPQGMDAGQRQRLRLACGSAVHAVFGSVSSSSDPT